MDDALKDTAYAHGFAAILGTFLGSPLAGMQLCALLSLLAIWSAIGFIFRSLPYRAFILSSLSLLFLLLINGFVRLGLHGREIVGNFFFAHFVAQAIVIVALAFSLHWEKQAINPWARYLFLAAVVLFVENFHLLPSLELLGFFVLLTLLDSCFLTAPLRRKYLMGSALLILFTLALLLINPAFESMRAISQNNGGVLLKHIAGLKSLFAFCFVVIIFSAELLRKWLQGHSPEVRKNLLLLKYLSLYGFSVTGLCVLQMLLLLVGEGSEYACKKYGFSINTLLVIDLAVLISMYLKPLWFYGANNGLYTSAAIRLWQIVFIPLLLLIVCFTVLSKKVISVSAVNALIQEVTIYRDALIEKSPPEKFNYAVESHTDPDVDFILSRSVLKVEHNAEHIENISDLVFERPFSKPERIDHLITHEGTRWDFLACRQHISQSGLVLLDGACVLARLAKQKQAYR